MDDFYLRTVAVKNRVVVVNVDYRYGLLNNANYSDVIVTY